MRIIDADEVLKEIKEYEDGCKMLKLDVDPRVIKQHIMYAPTVDPWHYPSKGEYPKIGEKVFCKDCVGEYNVAEYQGNSVEGEPPWLFYDRISDDYVRAWQYIVPPKEEA